MLNKVSRIESREALDSGQRRPHPLIPGLETVDVIGLKVAAIDYAGAVEAILAWAEKGDRAYAVSAANTHVSAFARHNEEFGEALSKFDLACPDGMPLVWAANHSLGEDRLLDRVYGPTLMLRALEGSAGRETVKHFLFGGAESTLAKLEQRMEDDFPETQLAGTYSPPFGDWPEDEFERICEKIKSSGANVVWVGLGCPKQELWIGKHLDRLPPAVYLGVGAAFAFHAGEVRQAPAFIQRFAMEWFYRLCMEPRRLWRRYLVHNSLFILYWLGDTMRGADEAPVVAVSAKMPRVRPIEPPSRCNVLGVGISVLNLESTVEIVTEASDDVGFSGFVTVTGVHGVMESRRDPELQKIHNQSFLSTPDGMPMVWIGNWSGFEEMDRVYGPDLMLDVVRGSSGTDRGHYFFGGAEGVATTLAERLQGWFPGTKVLGTECPPYRELTLDEERGLVARIQKEKPHFFWVGLSTPKQERFMHGFLKRNPDLTKGWDHGIVFFGVGAAFDFHSGRVQQAPRWMQRQGLEWFFRFCMEPLRLWKRYSINNSGFIYAIGLQLLRLKKYPIKK